MIAGKETEDIVNLGLSYVPEGREVFAELTVDENLRMGAYIRRDRQGIKEDLGIGRRKEKVRKKTW